MKDKHIVFLDVETTGTDLIKDRIVQIAAAKTNDKFEPIEPARSYLINPGGPIPPEATEIHGITDEMVKDKPSFAALSKSFLAYLSDCNIAGFNIIDFDVPLIDEELRRAGLKWNYDDVIFLDAFRIFREKEKRDLSAAVRFYTGREHEGAHDAKVDILATVDVLAAQLKTYKDLAQMDPAQLMEFCRGGQAVDLSGKIVLKDGIPIFSFGKHKNEPVKDNAGFVTWMLKSDFTTNTKEVVKNIMGWKDKPPTDPAKAGAGFKHYKRKN